jgi:iron complex transport system permease protein
MRRPASLAALLGAAMLALGGLGLAAGAEGWSFAFAREWELIGAIRAPRTLGALLVGAVLGLAGAIAQGLFRNPLADPYLLGSAAGAGLGVVLVLAASGGALGAAGAWLALGIQGAAFAGALAGVLLTLTLARGAGRAMVLLLAGIVVGVLLTAAAELVLLAAPDALRERQVFMLGSTSLLGWGSVWALAAALGVALGAALPLARALDALVLGEDTAASLGVPLASARWLLVAAMALASGAAVAHSGMVGFVGLVAPHLVRRSVVVTHRALLALSALAGAVLLGAADLLARWVAAPQELPVGLFTALAGGSYLLWLLRRNWA